jgi:peptidoglycan/xylan/chitin deacetylase (PgdA/CDA1 family)
LPTIPSSKPPDRAALPSFDAGGRPILYLTFDDGPHPRYTMLILNLLDQHDARATFFVLGLRVVEHPAVLREIASRGHAIGVHTWDHRSLRRVSDEVFADEIACTWQVILAAAGDLLDPERDVRYLRPPMGETDAHTGRRAASLGMAVVLWDIDPQDWREIDAGTLAGLLSAAYPGAIVLLHDGGGSREQTVGALRIALPLWKEQGYVFRSLRSPEMDVASFSGPAESPNHARRTVLLEARDRLAE